MRRMIAPRALALSALSMLSMLSMLSACSKEEGAKPEPKAVDASVAPAAPKNLDLAKAALVSAKAKYAKHEAGDADCAPLKSLQADFAKDKTPDALKTTREINVFCDIDIALEGAVTTLKSDQEKLAAAVKKKDRAGEQMYAATVKDGCAAIKKQLESLAIDHIDGEPKVATLKAEIDPICSPPSKK